jgi:hypothetical protein
MNRVLCAFVLAVAGLGLFPQPAVATPFQACFVYPHDSGCTRNLTVQVGYHVKLKATADWHSGRRVYLFQADPRERRYHLVRRLRFDSRGHAVYRWDAPTHQDCCWRWRFKAIDGHGDIVGRSNRLKADARFIDE